ncbi:tetratricopeptide repeat protein [Frankia sp. CcWB2]
MVTVLPRHSPYVGLTPFQETDAEFFFGRRAAAHALLAKWLESRLVVLHGRAGVGKTSLLWAGVLPNLVSTDADVLPVGPDADDGLVRSTGNPYLESLLRCWAGDADTWSLVDAIQSKRHGHGAAGRDRQLGSARPILAAVDQFEDFFVPHSPYLDPLRTQFVEVLGEAVAALPDLHLLLVIRRNHRAALAPYEDTLAGGSTIARVAVGPLDRRSATAALTEPLRAAGRRLPPGVAQACVDGLVTSRVVDATGTESVLVASTVQPAYLQLVATAIWRSPLVTAGPATEPAATEPVTGAQLAETGDASMILGAYLTQAIVAVAREHDLDDGEVCTWLTRTFITERGRRGAVDEGIETTAGMPTTLLDALVERYVLASEWRSGSRRFELFDDRLIPPLQEAFPDWSVAGRLAGAAGAADFLQAALVSFADGDVVAARGHVDEALLRSPDGSRTTARTSAPRAELDEAQARPEQAEQGYREAAELYESLSDTEGSGRALAAIGRLLLRGGQYGRAIEDFQAASARLPADSGVQADLARALWYSGQPWGAAAIFSTVLTIAPEPEAALAGRGQLRVELGDDVSALEDLERVTRLAPDVAGVTEVRATRALALARLGRSREASDETAAVLDAAPDSGPVLWRAAGVARAAGEDTRADDLLRRALDARDPALLPHQQEQVLRSLRRSGAMA